jgi:Arc/MetJ-type ribon-helix-helix transcriptional regulator
MASDETGKNQPFTPEEQERIRARGMTFEVFLPEAIATWLREKIAAGVFKDPAEAAFVAFQEMRELDQHSSVRQELLTAIIQTGAADSSEGSLMDEIRTKLQAQLRQSADTDPPNDSK